MKADDKTVASVRRDESTAEIPQLEKTTGADGKQRKSRAKKKPKPVYNKLPVDPYAVGDACVVAALEAESAVEHRVTASPEVSVEQRRAEHAALTVEHDLEADEYRAAFLLRAADALAFAVYSGEIDKEVIAAAKRVAVKWENLALQLAAALARP